MHTEGPQTPLSVLRENASGAETFPPGYYHNVSLLIWKIVPPIIIPLGTTGNILTIIVILRQIRKTTSISLFLLCLAVSDMLVLYTVTLRHWIRNVWETDIRDMSDAGCKAHAFLTYVSMQLSSWLLVAVTTERVFSVVVPHRVKFICTNKTVLLLIGLILALIFGLNAHILYGVGLKSDADLGYYDLRCSTKAESYKLFFYSIWPWIDFTIVFALPFAIFICSNVLIISKIASHNKRWRSIQGDKDNKRLTILLIWLCIFFFLCLTPSGIYFIVSPYWRTVILAQESSRTIHYDLEYMAFWYAIINCISYLNATCNFIFYVLSGARFRQEIINLITCRKSNPEGVFGSGSRQTASTMVSGSPHALFRTSQKEISVIESQISCNNHALTTRL